MSSSRPNKNYPFVAKPMWKESPPGEAQQHLNGLFKRGAIEVTDTPKIVYSEEGNEVFRQFSLSVFATHFNKTKKKSGMLGKKLI
jgi:hypothetical protein